MSNTLFLLSDVMCNDKIRLKKEDSEETIIGEIILNRLVGIAYDKLIFDELNKETTKTMRVLKKYYDSQYDLFVEKLKFVSSIMRNADYKCAFLKGAVLIPMLYKKGQRISNDIDLLIDVCDVSKAHSHLTANGFVQGHCDESGTIIPATRREIIESKMNFGETVPYLRYYSGNLIEVDLNFSLDFKAKGNRNIVNELLNRSEKIAVEENIEIDTLSKIDFLIHLCCHLYKEATTYDWLAFRRDLMLYKFSDINVFLHHYHSQDFLKELQERIKSLSLEKECYYTLENSCIIYPALRKNLEIVALLEEIKPDNLDFMKRIQYPMEKKQYMYHMDFEEWFACSNRIAQLQEC